MVYLMQLGILWTIVQLLVFIFFKNSKTIIPIMEIGHTIYRSIMCCFFFISGLFLYLSFVILNNFSVRMEEQIALWDISLVYMIFDIIFMCIQKILKYSVRSDLIVHHIIAIIGLYLCGYTYCFIWSIISVSEVLSLWSGIGAYAQNTNNHVLLKYIYILRALTLLFIRLPWWLVTIYNLKYINNQYVFFWYLIGIKLIMCLDMYWLSECLKRLIVYKFSEN